jgi:hypothetical protein
MTLYRTIALLPLLAARAVSQNVDVQELKEKTAEVQVQVMNLRGLTKMQIGRSTTDEHFYDSGTRALDANRWEDAIRSFSQAAARKGPHADGSLYWKAYAENRLGQRDTALATIVTLKKDYPASRWLNDAQALEVEVRQQSGKPVNPLCQAARTPASNCSQFTARRATSM